MATIPAAPIPVITDTGITGGDFAAWLAWRQGVYQAIFGADIDLGNDTQDGQLIAIEAQKDADLTAACIAVYNSFSPSTAQGVGLSSVVKINGLARLVPTFSSFPLVIVGVASRTTITNGEVQDSNGNNWLLPASVTIPNSGAITVTVTAQVAGAVVPPAAGASLAIQTPTFGWQTATAATGSVYSAGAITGTPVETDAALRVRQAVSTELPAQTIVDGIWGALQNLPGVTRAQRYENNTGSPNSFGMPSPAVAFVVQGGTQAQIIGVIGLLMTPGIPLFGNIAATWTSVAGSTRAIKYSSPTESTISVALTILPLSGWSTAIQPVIAQNIATYLSSLPIGQNVSYTALFVAAYAALSQYPGAYNITAMTIAKGAGAPQTADLTIAWNEAPVGNANSVTFSVT